MLLKDKTAVIYGGAGAVGAATATVFAREGARLFLAGRTRSKLERVAAGIRTTGGAVEIAQVDVLDTDAVQSHADAVARQCDAIDIALNAVSFAHDQGTKLPALSLEMFMSPVHQFLRALFNTSKAAASHMRKGSVILTMSAPSGRLTVPGHLGHSVSCAGIEAFSRLLAADLAPNVRVVCLRPHAIGDAPAAGSYTGPLITPKAEAAGITLEDWMAGAARATMLQRLPTLSEVAETAAFLASSRAGAITAATVNLSSGAITD
jgi:NAD(P)-dependent dehydrogenase (short-subunit alcohol dehydrogenase family)